MRKAPRSSNTKVLAGREAVLANWRSGLAAVAVEANPCGHWVVRWPRVVPDFLYTKH
jgi:hypothetical protein